MFKRQKGILWCFLILFRNRYKDINDSIENKSYSFPHLLKIVHKYSQATFVIAECFSSIETWLQQGKVNYAACVHVREGCLEATGDITMCHPLQSFATSASAWNIDRSAGHQHCIIQARTVLFTLERKMRTAAINIAMTYMAAVARDLIDY